MDPRLIFMKRKESRLQDLLDIEQQNQLRMALKSTYAQRLQDLQDMLDFNAEAEARNPRLRRIADRMGESQAPGDDA